MNKDYKFTIEYFYDIGLTRTAIVYADNLTEAKEKIAKVDSFFDGVAKVSFEEMVEDNYY